MKKEYTFEELGYFAERECQALKDCLQGFSYMDFDIKWSNYAGNCTLIVATDYEAEEKRNKRLLFTLCVKHDISDKEGG